MDALSVGTSRTPTDYQWTLMMPEWVICGLSTGFKWALADFRWVKVGINTAWMGHQLAPIDHGYVIS